MVSGLAMAVNPQCIVVGGELAETGELLLGPLREAIRQRVLLNQIAPLEVVPAELGQRAEVVGALELVLRSTDFVVRSDEQARSRVRARVNRRWTIDARDRSGFHCTYVPNEEQVRS